MYKMIIADDETGIHDLLKDAIEEFIDGFKVVGCFLNGREAIDYLTDNKVDVVLTDIKMPIVDGLALCKYIHENRPETKVIILSGYGEFEYAKEAIKYNVTDYLLKAVDMKELSVSLKKIEKELNASRDMHDRDDSGTDRFCTDLIVGALSENEIRREYCKLNMPYDIDNVKVSIYQIDFKNYDDILKNAWRYESEYFHDAVFGVIQSVVRDIVHGTAAEIFSNRQRIIIGVFCDSNLNQLEEHIAECLKDITGLEITCAKISEEKRVFEVSNDNNILDNKEIYKIMVSYIKLLSPDKAKSVISRMMKTGNVKESSENEADYINSTYENIKKQMDDKKIIENVKEYIARNFDKDISRKDIADSVFFNAAYFPRFFKQITGISLGNYILEVRMDNAIKYLETNTKIQDIAAKSGFKNVRHFQRMFKEYTGFSPTDYRKMILKKD